MPRYWFITALGFVIVFTAIINYLNQPIEMAVDSGVSVATAPVQPRPASTLAETPSVADAASQASLAEATPGVSDVNVNAQPTITQVLASADLRSPDELAEEGAADTDALVAVGSEAAIERGEETPQVEQVGGLAEAAPQNQPVSVAAPATADETGVSSSEIDVKGAAQAVVASAAEPPAEDVTGQSSGWLVEASGGLSASDVGQPARAPDGVDTLLSTKSEGIGQQIETATPDLGQPELQEVSSGGDDEVAAILAETATQARRNLGLPEEEQAAPAEVAALSDGESVQAEQAVSTQTGSAQTGSVQTGSATDFGSVSATPGWEASAANVPPSDGPMVAVIIDDLGWSARRTSMVSTLSSELTLAMLTDADDAPRQASQARELGHELLIHVPMQATSTPLVEGNQLDVGMSEEELRLAIDAAVGSIDGAIGINNHMGSLFTADETSMRIVLDQVRRHGLVYVDSLTTADSVAEGIAEEIGVPYLRRDVFLDNERDGQAIAEQLSKLEEIAQRRGWAVAIGHPYIETIDALAAWIPTLKRKGIDLIPVSTLIRLRLQDTQTAERPTNG